MSVQNVTKQDLINAAENALDQLNNVNMYDFSNEKVTYSVVQIMTYLIDEVLEERDTEKKTSEMISVEDADALRRYIQRK